MSAPRFLGLDLSTQSLTALIIDLNGDRVIRRSLNFEHEMSHYHIRDGCIPGPDPTEALVDPIMWVEGLERMLLGLKEEGLTRNIAAISVAAQQHGSVYLKAGAARLLGATDPALPLHEALAGIFSRDRSPIWMDSSTSRECAEIDAALGGAQETLRITGSVVSERFTGPQIRKFWKTDPDAYARTGHIALVSSFLTSLLVGEVSPLDCGDGLGTNLVDIQSRDWNPAALRATAPDLASKLPQVVNGDRKVGQISPYMCRRYGFSAGCDVLIGTGDNPASLAGLGLVGNSQARAVSLGTSDTYFGYTSEMPTYQRASGHLFGTVDGGLMFLLCFKNGSLARERVRGRYGLEWDQFSDILLSTPPGNAGRIMLPYFWTEITPVVLKAGVRRFGGLTENDAAANVRALAEAQVMSMWRHSGWTGQRPDQILVTAGGSENRGLLKLIAQVFGAKVQSFELNDSTALGAAVRAAAHWLKEKGKPVEMSVLSRRFAGIERGESIEAAPQENTIFQGENGLLQVYAACEKYHLGQGPDPTPAIDRFRARYC